MGQPSRGEAATGTGEVSVGPAGGDGNVCPQASDLFIRYLNKWLGVPGKKEGARVPSLWHSFVSLIQATLSITCLAFLDLGLAVSDEDFMFLVGSFGATAVLLYSAHTSPLAQPRNVIWGHFVSSVAGVTVYKVMGNIPYLSAGFAVGLAIFLMERTNSVHPPGGATALIAIVGGDAVHKAGYMYVLFPCVTGATLMLLVALICNNLDPERVYPQYWSHYFPIYEKTKRAFVSMCGSRRGGGAPPPAVSPSSSSAAAAHTHTHTHTHTHNEEGRRTSGDVEEGGGGREIALGAVGGNKNEIGNGHGAAGGRRGGGEGVDVSGHVIDPVVEEERDELMSSV